MTSEPPAGWQPVVLGEHCTKIGSGATPRGGEQSYVPEGRALIRSQNVRDFAFSWEGLARIDDGAAEQLNGVTVEAGDILLNITGQSVARCCSVPDEALPARVNQHVSIIRCDQEVLCTAFVKYVLLARKPELLTLASAGATREALTKTMIEDITILAPPIDEQHRIAWVLGTLDSKIEANRRAAATLEAIISTLFRAECVDFNGYPQLEASEMGPIPSGWSAGIIADVASVHKDLEKRASDLPYIGLDAMPRSSTVLTEWESADIAPKGQSAKFEVGDILFGKLRPYFRKVGVAPIRGRCSTEILVLRPTDPAYFGFVLGHISSQRFIDHCVAVSRGTKMPRSEWADAGTFPVAIPSTKTAARFNRVAEAAYKQIRALVLESQTLAKLRDRLLTRLVDGKVRVAASQPDEEAA